MSSICVSLLRTDLTPLLYRHAYDDTTKQDRLSRMDIEMPGEGVGFEGSDSQLMMLSMLVYHEYTTLTPDYNVSRRKLRRRKE